MLRQILRKVASQLRRQVRQRVIPHTMHALSFLRSHRHPLFSWPDQKPLLGPRVALFVHFDRRGAVRPYVRQYLASLQEAGFSTLFVTNSEKLLPEALDAVQKMCAGVLIRRNIGYDFGAMREGLEHFGLPHANTEMLAIANDSVYGPLVPLDDLFSRIDFKVADLWGTTDSWQQRYHLQSYFLVASPALLRHKAWKSFWNQVRPVANKTWVISRYEVGITQWMLLEGVQCAAIWPYSSLVRDSMVDSAELTSNQSIGGVSDPMVQRRAQHVTQVRADYGASVALNPTSDLWRRLLRSGFPFVKRELLRDNPSSVADLADWRDEVMEISPGHVALIERDLQLVLRNKAP